MKLGTGLLIAGCVTGGVVVLAGSKPKKDTENPQDVFSDEFDILDGLIREIVNDDARTVEDLLELVPMCLHMDCKVRDALGKIPEPGITAILARSIVIKAVMADSK